MAPKSNPTQTTTVHNTDTDTSAGHANNQVVTRHDLDMLAQNLTAAFFEQLCAVINHNNPTQQRVLEDMADQIKNLQERIKSHYRNPTNLRMGSQECHVPAKEIRRDGRDPRLIEASIEVTATTVNPKPLPEMPVHNWKARSREYSKAFN